MPFHRLRPGAQSYPEVSRRVKKEFHAVVLVEGPSDAEVLEAVAKRRGLEPPGDVALVEAGGLMEVRELLEDLAALAKVARRLKLLAVLVDADNQEPQERAEMLMNHLRSRGLATAETHRLEGALFQSAIGHMKTLICVAGLSHLRQGDAALALERRTLEDHLLQALLHEGRIAIGELARLNLKTSKKMVEVLGLSPAIVGELSPETIDVAFRDIVKMLMKLAST